MPLFHRRFIFVASLLAGTGLSSATGFAAALPGATPFTSPQRGWLHFDAPLWDIADEGLPFRLTLSRPSSLDPVSLVFHASEARWTFSAGYAKVYHSYDRTTGIFKNAGGHTAIASAGRQFRWSPPGTAARAVPDLALELGIHAATRRFPPDGTHVNVKLITGLEWVFARATPREWSLGVMWLHFSNAYVFSRNAGYDGLALRLGRRL